MQMDKVIQKTTKKKRKQENNTISVEPSILDTLTKTHIILLTKPSNKFPRAQFVCKICPYHMDDVDRALKHAHDNLHKRNLNKHHTKNLLTYLPNPKKLQIEAVNECLESVMKHENFISKDEYQRRVDICMKMNELAVEINQGNKLVICGSLLTGLSIVDVSDVNLYLDSQSKDTKNTGYLSELQKLALVFKSKLSLKSEIKLEKNCSGLFCKDKKGITYHLSANNSMSRLNSELIRIYLKIDSRAEQLAKLFRLFAHKSFIDQTKDGLFPSQTFALLVIFYLQQLRVPILPNLHRLADSKNSTVPEASLTHVVVNNTPMIYVSDLEWIKQNWTPPMYEASLADLWIGLLRFYVVDFNSSAYMVSIRSTEPVLKADRHIVNKRLAIENPFDPKRNILFAWNTPDVIDFVNDQLQGGYIYFAVPQLVNGPAFRKVSFSEISLANMKSTANVCPIFTLNNFTETLEVLEMEFKKFYTEEKAYYDVSRWPAELFVKGCLDKILTAIYNNAGDIRYLITLLELKTKNGAAFFSIDNYGKFKEYAVQLAKCILHEFAQYMEVNNLWSQQELNNRIGFELIKLSCQMFLNESLNISGSDDDEEDDILDSDMNELDEANAEREFPTEEVDEMDSGDTNLDYQSNDDHVETNVQNSESWKLPIVFKQIYVYVKGTVLSSENPDEYNEHKINSLEKKDLVYNFNKMSIHDKKLVIVCTFCNTKGHRKENCGYAIPRFEELQDVLRTIDPAWLEKLKNVLNEKHKTILPEPDRLKLNEKVFDRICEKIKSLFPTSRPQMFGSTINGFMTRASDLDICLEFYVDNQRETLSNKDVVSRLVTIGRELKKMEGVKRVESILKAKVPIIKFYLRNNAHGDISINNSLGLQNTKMLKLYAEIGNGVKILGNLLKFMSKTCEIGDASQGTLSSYAYILMLVHFLQKRGVLPVLQELYEGERPTHIIDGWDAWYQSDMATIYKLWEKKPVAKNQIEYLWLDFFYYYAVEFDITKEVVTIRQSQPLFKIDKNWQSSYMAVEDPFDLSHNLCGSLCLENCRYILECFAHVLKMHSNSSNLSRPDQVHYMLFEPTALRPMVTNDRSCYNCSKTGHIARDCTDKSAKQTPTKAVVSNQSLPVLTSPLQFKPSNVASRVYLQSEFMDSNNTENQTPYNIPLKSFKADLDSFSVVPISMKFGDQTVIVPMLVGKNDVIEKKLNAQLKNGLTNNVCVFPGVDSARHQNETPVKHIMEYQNHSPINNNYRRQTPNKSGGSNYYEPRPMIHQIQQHPNRQQIMQHQSMNQQRINYDVPIRMMANHPSPGPRFSQDYGNIPPGFHYQPQAMRHYNQIPNWYGPEQDNRRTPQAPLNNNHGLRGNRK